MNKVTILITACGNAYMHGTCKSIKENGEIDVKLIGVDMNKDDTILQMCDSYYQVPRGDDPMYIDSLLEICKKEHVDILIPVMSVELETLAMNIKKFEEAGTKVSISSIESLAIANNKLSLFKFLEKEGLPCPKYVPVNTIEDIDKAIKEIGVPCVFKTDQGSGSRGMRIIDPNKSRYDILFHEKPNSFYITLDDFKNTLKEGKIPPMHAMEYLPGNEYTVDLLVENGDVKYSMCRRGLNVQSSIIIDGICEDRPEITNMCNIVAKKLKLNGNIGFDIKENTNGIPVIMECNPRVTAGVSEFTASGVNLLLLNIKMLLGMELPQIKPKYGVMMKRRYIEMYC